MREELVPLKDLSAENYWTRPNIQHTQQEVQEEYARLLCNIDAALSRPEDHEIPDWNTRMRRIRNLNYWIDILPDNNGCWCPEYLFQIIRCKLRNMGEDIAQNKFFKGWEDVYEDLRLCVNLCNILLEEHESELLCIFTIVIL